MTALVVGGGLAGLLAARRLRGRGHDVVVLESGARPGGMISPVRVGSTVVDGGAEAIATRSTAALQVCDDLGLTVHAPHGRPHVWWTDVTAPLADGVLGIPHDPADAALDVLGDDERARALEDLAMDPQEGSTATTVGELVERRMGPAVVEKLVAPLTRGVYRSTPHDMPLAAFAPRLLDALATSGSLIRAVAAIRDPRGAVAQPDGGLFTLVDALARDLDVVTDAPVHAIHRRGSAWVAEGPWGSRTGDRLVVTTPAAVTARLLAPLGVEVPDLPTHTSHVAVLTSTHPALDDAPVGSGVLLGEPAPGVAATALTHYSHKWPWVDGDHVVRMTYGSVPTEEQMVSDASALLRVDLAGTVTGSTVRTWRLPGRISRETGQTVTEQAAAAGVDVLGCWVSGNGIAPIVEAVGKLQ